ncbi:hypothetical protein AURDEDRAFT_184369 [Auricularia subglabra TFB-10046 SS5]|nr:hypothetical protein AURDEDRAFT_184369 [Auricularia subglabra TFB-10046 SS5]
MFNITNQPPLLRGDALIKAATEHLERIERRQQQERDEVEARQSGTRVAEKENIRPPWPSPKPDSVHGESPSVDEHDGGSDFGSYATASPIQVSRTLDANCKPRTEADREMLVKAEQRGGQNGLEQAIKDLAREAGEDTEAESFGYYAVDARIEVRAEQFGTIEVPEPHRENQPIVGAETVARTEDEATSEGHTSAQAQMREGTETHADMQPTSRKRARDSESADGKEWIFRRWIARAEPFDGANLEDDLAAIRQCGEAAKAQAVLNLGKRRLAEEQRQAVAAERAAKRLRVQHEMAAEAFSLSIGSSAEAAPATITNYTAVNADNEQPFDVGADKAELDEANEVHEGTEGDDSWRGLINFNAPRTN